MVLVPDSGHVAHACRLGCDEGRFGDEEGAGDGGTLSIVFCYEGERDVVVVCTEAGEGRHDDAVLKL